MVDTPKCIKYIYFSWCCMQLWHCVHSIYMHCHCTNYFDWSQYFFPSYCSYLIFLICFKYYCLIFCLYCTESVLWTHSYEKKIAFHVCCCYLYFIERTETKTKTKTNCRSFKMRNAMHMKIDFQTKIDKSNVKNKYTIGFSISFTRSLTQTHTTIPFPLPFSLIIYPTFWLVVHIYCCILDASAPNVHHSN